MSDAPWLLLASSGWIGAGLGATALLTRARTRDEVLREELLGLAILLGVGLTAWLQFVFSLCGGRLGFAASSAAAAIGTGLGLTFLLRRRLRRPASATTAGTGAAPRRPPSAQLGMWGLSCVAVCVLCQSLLTPQRLWDERAIFGMKAAVLWEDGGIDSPALNHPDFVQGHPRYPLLLPLAEQHLYALLGRVDDRWGKLVPPVLVIGLALAYTGVLSRGCGAGWGALWGLLLATTPALTLWDYGCLSAQADAPIACLHGLAVLYLWDWLRGPAPEAGGASENGDSPTRGLAIAGLAAGLALFTKDEGLAFLLVDGAALAFLLILPAGAAALVHWTRGQRGAQRVRPAIQPLSTFAAAAMLVALPWLLHRRTLPTTNEMQYLERLSWETLIAGADRATWGVQHLLQRMFLEAHVWGLAWWGALAAVLLHPRRAMHPAQLLLVLDIIGGLAGLLIAGILAPLPVEDHLGGSAHRFLMQLIPSAVLLQASLWCERRPAPAARRSPGDASEAVAT